MLRQSVARLSPSAPMFSMKQRPKPFFISLAVVTALGAVLVVLAVLQYQWSTQVAEADRERLQTTLQTAMNQFREDLHRELANVGSAFEVGQVDGAKQAESLFAERYVNWERSATHRALIANVYFWENSRTSHAGLFRLDSQTGRFEAMACPAQLAELCARLNREPGRGPGEFGPPVLPLVWSLHTEIPALIHPVLGTTANSDNRLTAILHPAGYVVIELSRDFLNKELFPELARRYFGGPHGLVYQVAVAETSRPGKVMYLSDAVPSQRIFASADGRIELFGPRYRRPSPPGTEGVARRELGFRLEGGASRRMLFERHHALTGPPRGFAPLLVVPDVASAGWELVVRHRAGSLGEAVAGMRRRNLGLSFGVLLVLAAGMVLIVVWTQRAQKLAKLQMDFVTGVSHELRTPVSVICSAAENLADGVVETASQVKQYGALIRNEGRRLREMVEQILLFASGQERRLALDSRPVDIREVIDSTLVEAENLIDASGFVVEKQVSSNLPPVMADPAALSQCLRNLITNALKYGSANRWMAVLARAGDGPQGEEIQITVRDRGQGIDPEDLPHVFEPFYRGSAARSSQVHGTGLGLSLVKEITEALGGRLTVMSTPGEGSSFTLHLPVARLEEQPLAKAV